MQTYTLAEAQVFGAAHARQARTQAREQLLLLRAAQADGKTFKRVLKALK